MLLLKKQVDTKIGSRELNFEEKHLNGLKIKNSNSWSSTIEAIASSDKIISQFLKLKSRYGTPSSKLNILCNLLLSINNTRSNATKYTKKLEELLDKMNAEKCGQKNPMALISVLMEEITEEIKFKENAEQILMPMQIEMLEKFKNVHIANRVHSYFGIHLKLCGNCLSKPGVSINYLVQEYFSPKLVDSDPPTISQMYIFQRIPEVLLLFIEDRNHVISEDSLKYTYYVSYEDHLSLQLDIATNLQNEKENVSFELVSLINNNTNSCGGYVTIRKRKGGWLIIKDDSVESTEFQFDVYPHLLFYEKRDP